MKNILCLSNRPLSSILGYGVTENEDMPDVGAGTMPLIFGNFKRAYTIMDRFGIRRDLRGAFRRHLRRR
ncbi:MAG: phage major capsid protein [Desulfovibrio sp.]|jgi:HK97 family phage major capsid protein|nr:phage major capsid protein [Desulfovibrio sp.]